MPLTAVTGQAQVATDTAAFEALAYYQLRQEFYFNRCADVQPTQQTHPGSSVVFNLLEELPITITPLAELTDVTAQPLADSTVSVIIDEFGNATTVSSQLRGTSYLVEMRRASEEIAYNGGKSFDTLARNPLLSGTQVQFAGAATSRVTIAATDVLSAAEVREALATLGNNSAKRFYMGYYGGGGMGDAGGYYKAFIPPDAFFDLEQEVGADSWREPRVQAGARVEDVWVGTAGVFEGFDFIVTPRLGISELDPGVDDFTGGAGPFEDGGAAGTVDVYPNLFAGRQALAKAWSEAITENGPQPVITIAPITDLLNRFRGVGWKWLGGFARFREESLVRVESASSLGAN